MRAEKPIELTGSWFLSDWLFAYVYKIGAWSWRARSHKDLHFRLRPQESARVNGDLLESQFVTDKQVLRAVMRIYGMRYALVGIWKLIWAVGTWLAAYYFLKSTIAFVEQRAVLDVSVGQQFAIALLVASVVSSVAIHQLYAECQRVGVQVRAAVSSLVYRKSLRLSYVRGGAGEVLNILSADLQRIVDGIVNFHFLWSAFLEAAAILAIAFYEIGISALPALGFVLLLLPVQMYLGKLTSETNRRQAATDRVHIMSEILTAIKLIKFYAWEKPFTTKISGIRHDEMASIYRNMMIKTVNFTVVFAVPVLIALCSLGMYVALGNKLTASVSFAVLSVLNTLRYPFFMLPMAVRGTVSTLEAMRRLDDFMALDEVEHLPISKNDDGDDTACEINNADFKWDGTDQPALRNIHLKVKKGAKVAIIGDVGAGKSSLISALLGQIRQVRGDRLKVYGTTSYASQEAWLLNTTLRDNVLFGMDYNKPAYKEVIRVCSLQRDLTLLIAGDLTEIAERGVNLSGGQRQRVNLARAVYHDCEIVLLDDPLSAVDQHVGSHIFNECFLKHLKDKTVIMSIHQLQYLEQMDWIVMMKNGEIEKQGTFADLMGYAEFKRLIENHVAGDDAEVDDEADVVNDPNFDIPDEKPVVAEIVVDDEQKNKMDREQLTVTELQQLTSRKYADLNEVTITSMIEKNQLSVIVGGGSNFKDAIAKNELSVLGLQEAEEERLAMERGKLVKEDTSTAKSGFGDLVTYARVAWGSPLFFTVCAYFFLVHGVRIGSDYWLRLWVPRIGGFTDAVYIGVYAGCTVVFVLGVFTRGWWFSRMTDAKASTLHDAVFRSIMRAPMSFFDSTPLARILSAFSKHQLHVDDTLPDALLQALQYAPLGLGALVLCAVIVPWNWAPIIGLVALAGLVVYLSSPAENKTKSLEAITKPPVFAHVTATLEGLFSIRAYHAQKRFDDMNLQKLDTNHEALFAMVLVKSWIALNLDLLSSLVVYFTALLIVVFRDEPDMASVAGLALSNALQMLVFVQWTVRMTGEVIGQMSSVGQLAYYGNNVPAEAPAEIPEKKPAGQWPEKGLVKFEKIGLRYTEFGVKVLKDVSFTIYPTEKIGIVGRTGSGKSTLLISLLRIVEACDGKITIDGVDISELGLEDLRTKIAIIPQEPVLFKGTIRSNLDPFGRSTDEEIWKALDAAHLGQSIRGMSDKLESAVIENGKNFSLGQRQLFCIARAILSKAKILVLDEATANVSPETDMLIQTTIRENFKDMTVLTIAHRLNTIIDSDRVLLLDAGRILEFDDPVELLNRKDGSFRDLVNQTGPATAKRLYEMAVEAQKKREPKRPANAVDENLTIQQLANMKQSSSN